MSLDLNIEKLEMLDKAIIEQRLPAKDVNFGQSLVTQYSQKKSLSDKQWLWVGKLTERANGKKEPKPEDAINLAGLVKLLTRAKEHLLYPRIVIGDGTGMVLRLSIAGDKSQYTGAIQIKEDGTKAWMGRVNTDGSLVTSRYFNESFDKPRLELLLRSIGDNPEKAAREWGHKSGQCCFCNKTLTDERSTHVGYGPVCAKNFKLEWGAK